MSDTLAFKNKETGEVVRFRKKSQDAPKQVRKSPESRRGHMITEGLIRQREGVGVTQPVGEYFSRPAPDEFKTLGGRVSNIGGYAKHAIDTGKEAMGAIAGTYGEVFRRGQAGISNPIIAMQQGRPEDAFGEFLQGVGGQRYGEFGDIVRPMAHENLPPAAAEAISGTVGLVGAAAAYPAMKAAAKAPLRAAKSLRPHTANHVEGVGRRIKEGISDLTKDVQNQYRKIFKTPMKDGRALDSVEVNKADVGNAIAGLPKSIKKEISTILGKNPIVEKVREARRLLDTRGGERAFVRGKGAVTASKEQIASAKQGLKDIMLKDADEKTKKAILDLDKKATEVYQIGKKWTNKVFDKSSRTVKTKPMLTSFLDKKDVGSQKELAKLAKYSPDLKDAYQDLALYARREGLKRLAVPAALTLGGGKLIHSAMSGGRE